MIAISMYSKDSSSSNCDIDKQKEVLGKEIIEKELMIGLNEAIKILKNLEDIQVVQITEKDVVRHKLVQDIIKAYDKYEEVKRRK